MNGSQMLGRRRSGKKCCDAGGNACAVGFYRLGCE